MNKNLTGNNAALSREGFAVPPQPPQVLDHQLLHVIGSGSYGQVWLARNILGTFRAVKVVYRNRFRNDRPYEREFEGIRKFEPISRSHEGLMDILQIGRDDRAGYFYYLMELADDAKVETESAAATGNNQSQIVDPEAYCPQTLKSELDHHGCLPFDQCVLVGSSLASAVGHLHQNGLLHRDIKPSNVICAGGKWKLADIGLVAQMGDTLSFVGTEGFIPPEGPGTAQADLYSLGKVLYEISTGKDRQDYPEPRTRLAAPNERDQWIEFNEVLLKACAADPRARYQSAKQMQIDFELLRLGLSVRRRRRARRWMWLGLRVSGAGAAVGLLVLGANLLLAHRLQQLEARALVGRGPMAGRIPPRPTEATRGMVDLSDYYTGLPSENWHPAVQAHDLDTLPLGIHQFAGIAFDVRGLVQLADSQLAASLNKDLYPQAVNGIRVGLRCRRLHFLHGTVGGTSDGKEIGRYIVHYDNGKSAAIPLIYGRDVRELRESEPPTKTVATGPSPPTHPEHDSGLNSIVAWTGRQRTGGPMGASLRFYEATWENPAPEEKVLDFSFESAMNTSAPFLIAVTAELTPEPASRLAGEDSALIKSHAGAYERIQPVAFGETRFTRVHLNSGAVQTNNACYDAFRFTTQAQPGLNLVWAMTRARRDSMSSWGIIGLDTEVKGGFKDYFHGQTAFYSNVPQNQGSELIVQFLDGRMLKPNMDYLIYFEFTDQAPLDSEVAMAFAAPAEASEADTVSLERALGLSLRAADAGAPTARNQTPRFHRHLCIGVR